MTPANGPSYYRDCLAKVGEMRQLAQEGAYRLRVGDRVSVCLDVEDLKPMAQGHGSWIDDVGEVRELYVPSFPTPFLLFYFFVFIFFGVCCEFCRTQYLLG